MAPSLSIVTPSLNQARFIERTIESVREQNYPGLEHIVVDGGSTDGTLEILKRCEHLPNFRWSSCPDAGQSDAINKGMRAATGEIAGWLNSDDEFFPGALRAIGEAFAKHPDAAVVYGAGAKIDEKGEIIKNVPYRPFDRRRLRRALYFLQPSMFFRRESFLAAGELNEWYHYAMDWDFLLRLPAGAEIVAIHAPIGKLRCYPAAKTQSGGWNRNREISNIARRANGPLDRNYFSFCARERLARLGSGAAGRLARKIADEFQQRIWGPGGCMIEGWPESDG